MIRNGALGLAIKNARIKKGISQEELAEIVDISPTHLKHIESEHRSPSVEVLFKIAEEINLSIDNLLYENDSPEFNSAKNLLSACTKKELKLITDIILTVHKNRDK